MYRGLHVQYPLLLSDLIKLDISRQILEKRPRYQISLKYVLWETSCSMQTEEQTDRHT